MPRVRRNVSADFRQPTSEAQLAAMRADVRARCEDRPGVYRMTSPDGEIVYVGKSKRVRTRLLSYFRCAPGEKGARIVREATNIEWEYTPSEFAALLAELRLIKKLRPRFNVAMKRDARHFAFIKVTRGPANKLLVVRGAGDESADFYYGPYHGAQRVNEAVRELNDALGLRDCGSDRKMHFADQAELFQLSPRTPGCIRYEIRKCLGPCVAACTLDEYAGRVRMARAFLEGVDDSPLDGLRREMLASSERMEFERAASLRDKLSRLETLREQFIRFRFAVETLSFLYEVPGHAGDDRVYLIRRGRVRAERPAPKSAADRSDLRALADDVFSGVEYEGAGVPSHEIDELLLLSSWFRRFPAELERTETHKLARRQRRSA
ncbi:MAG: GIY-YIG nuclease family protein [Gemmatimonadaceae bacterium]|nr:GIY-YIG nuclease family protein [Gemmatimonadaceae bacterium]NUQ93570.1 GIY-YIG nuclease family protein [Gemmatimonadaceae bacterium]NUR18587.1 GIY-YIG nuclease family protein [Gemmatimonadaceae bacterium]NUS96655.1 GIY-YIG nuclease family protein [Gemmatimonadaceae bacterium]